MAFDNTVTFAGNLVRDPELKYTPSGAAVCSFGVAVNGGTKDDPKTHFIDVTCWSQLAENVAESVPKGARVLVNGRLDQQSWETDDGGKRTKLQVVAEDVGPSLKWATSEVVKNERRDGSGSSAAPAQAKSHAYSENEEPF